LRHGEASVIEWKAIARAGSSFVNFLVDHPNETEKTKFGYLGDPNNQIFGYFLGK
jgi:hypothetical protein